jgi:hypothetical protein
MALPPRDTLCGNLAGRRLSIIDHWWDGIGDDRARWWA